MNKPKILIVDDHLENLLALRAVLDSPNYEIIDCTSGKDALKCLLNEHYDLILMDVQMPEMDGFTTAQMIRTRSKCDSIPLIFVSAILLDEESALKGYNAGCVDYITKPFHPETLKKKVEFFLNYSQRLREEQRSVVRESEYARFMNYFNELINPLWSVLLNVQVLRRYSVKDRNKALKNLDKKLEIIESSTKQLKTLIETFKSKSPTTM